MSRPLRRRVRGAILLATTGALVVFAVPMAVAVRSVYVQQAEAELEREAQRVLALVPDEQRLATEPLPASLDGDVRLAAYNADGRLTTGDGPSRSATAADSASTGRTRTVREGADLATFVPMTDEVRGSVRAALPSATLSARYYRAWALMLLLALGVLVLAWWASGRLARRLSRPLERLAGSAEALGGGGFALHVPRSGVTEVDVVASVLEESGRRLGDRFARERAFTADASHQLRTPITALRLTLEGAAADPRAVDPGALTREALGQVDRLESTVEDLLALARDLPGPAEPVHVAEVVRSLETRYRDPLRTQGRELVLDLHEGLPAAAFPGAALRQVLDVLVDNALVHGAGAVTVAVRSSGTGVAVDVVDEGRLPSGDPERMFRRRSPEARGTGIGLALARSLAEADGARLLAAPDGGGRTTFTLLMTEWAADVPTISS